MRNPCEWFDFDDDGELIFKCYKGLMKNTKNEKKMQKTCNACKSYSDCAKVTK